MTLMKNAMDFFPCEVCQQYYGSSHIWISLTDLRARTILHKIIAVRHKHIAQ